VDREGERGVADREDRRERLGGTRRVEYLEGEPERERHGRAPLLHRVQHLALRLHLRQVAHEAADQVDAEEGEEAQRLVRPNVARRPRDRLDGEHERLGQKATEELATVEEGRRMQLGSNRTR